MPSATQSYTDIRFALLCGHGRRTCQEPITILPRTVAGETSAEKMGITLAFVPIAIPKRIRQTMSCQKVCVNADPIDDPKLKTAAKKMQPRRPNRLLRGSLSQQPIKELEK